VPVKGVFPPPQPVDPIINPNAKQQTETTVMSLEGKTRPVKWWESRARISRYTNDQGFQDPVDPGFDFDVPFRSQVDVERREAEWLNSIFLGKWSTSTVGFGYRHEEGDNKGVFKTARHVPWALFEEQLRFFGRLFITGGFRIEDGKTGFLFEPGSLGSALSRARHGFNEEPGRLVRMAEAAYVENESAIDMDACARPLVEALLESRGRGLAGP
jgi:hypothetical protein